MTARTAVVFAALVAFAASARGDELTPAILDPVLAIQAALAKDSMTGVQSNAAAIDEQATKLGAPAAKVAAAARELKSAAKLPDARTAFGTLSDALVAYIDAQKLTLDPRIHVASCPMANKPWLQAGDTIANPYYGSEMPTCGSLKK